MSNFVILVKPGFLHLKEEIMSMLDVTILKEQMVIMSENVIQEFYKEHLDKGFFPILESYMLGNVVYAFKVEGNVAKTRLQVGHTDPKLAEPNSIRGKYGVDKTKNAVHCSDSEESGLHEIETMQLT